MRHTALVACALDALPCTFIRWKCLRGLRAPPKCEHGPWLKVAKQTAGMTPCSGPLTWRRAHLQWPYLPAGSKWGRPGPTRSL
jgi:hypothetical protein